jgi:tRNA A-37 threonylcarbamoyl transferase component Bud32
MLPPYACVGLDMRCTACNHTNPPGSRFCNACGSPLRPPADDETVAGSPLTPLPAIGPTIVQHEPPPAPAAPSGLAPGVRLGPAGRYLVERPIGRGGFGQAYLVYDHQLNRYCVAKQLALNPQWSERNQELAQHNFRREAQLLVTLNTPGHPNIPEIYEYLPDHSCLVMKYIEGRNLDEVLRERGGSLPTEEALPIMRAVCSALVYMHSRQPEPVLHRDIKPSNILLDNAGRVWLIDFGLSKAVPAQLAASDPQHTQLSGTPGFTPPEQWRGEAEPRSDVYALAATLYVLLTGYRPAVNRNELVEIVRGRKRPFPPLAELNATIHQTIGDLIERGLAFAPQGRPDAPGFLRILEEHIAPAARLQTPSGGSISDEQSLATWAEANWDVAVSWLYSTLPTQIEELLGKNRLAAELRLIVGRNAGDQHAGLDAALALLDPAGFGAARPHLTADRQSIAFGRLAPGDRAEQIVALRNDGRRYLRAQVKAPPWLLPNTLTVSLPPGRSQRLRLVTNLRRGTSIQPRSSLVLNERSGLNFRLDVHIDLLRWGGWLGRLAPERAGPAWGESEIRPLKLISAHRGGVWGLAMPPDGNDLATGGWDHRVLVWQTSTGKLLRALDEQAGTISCLRYSPNGRLLAAVSERSIIKLWDVKSFRLYNAINSSRIAFDTIRFSPDGQLLYANGDDKVVRVWRVSDVTLTERYNLPAEALDFVCSPDGEQLILACEDKQVRLLSLKTGETIPLNSDFRDTVNCIECSPDGQIIVAGGADGLVSIWETEHPTPLHKLRGHQGAVRAVAIHPDREVLASGGIDGSIKLWKLQDGELLQVLNGHSSGVLTLCFSPDGKRLISGGGDGVVIVWGAG